MTDSQKTSPSPYVLNVKFDRCTLNIKEPQNWGALGPPCGGGVTDHPYVCYHVKFGSSASYGVHIGTPNTGERWVSTLVLYERVIKHWGALGLHPCVVWTCYQTLGSAGSPPLCRMDVLSNTGERWGSTPVLYGRVIKHLGALGLHPCVV